MTQSAKIWKQHSGRSNKQKTFRIQKKQILMHNPSASAHTVPVSRPNGLRSPADGTAPSGLHRMRNGELSWHSKMHRSGATARHRPPPPVRALRARRKDRLSSRIRKAKSKSAATDKENRRRNVSGFHIIDIDQPITRTRITPSITFMPSAIAAASAPVTSIMVYA